MAVEYLLQETTGKLLLEDGTSGLLLESSFPEPRPVRINTSQGWVDIADATSFVSGTGTPTAAVGATGAVYLNTASGLLYGPKAGGAWPGTPITVPAGTPADATTSSKGIVQLAGDLAGTAAAPQVKYFDASGNLTIPPGTHMRFDGTPIRTAVRGPDTSRWLLLGGSAIVTTDVNGGATIPWGVTVASVLTVVVTGGQGWNLPDMMVNVDDAAPPTTTGFSIRARNTATNVFVASGSVRVQWIAMVALP